MKVTVQAGGAFNPPTVMEDVDATVLSTDAGDPILVAIRMKGVTVVKQADEEDFGEIMQLLGFDASSLPRVKRQSVTP